MWLLAYTQLNTFRKCFKRISIEHDTQRKDQSTFLNNASIAWVRSLSASGGFR